MQYAVCLCISPNFVSTKSADAALRRPESAACAPGWLTGESEGTAKDFATCAHDLPCQLFHPHHGGHNPNNSTGTLTQMGRPTWALPLRQPPTIKRDICHSPTLCRMSLTTAADADVARCRRCDFSPLPSTLTSVKGDRPSLPLSLICNRRLGDRLPPFAG